MSSNVSRKCKINKIYLIEKKVIELILILIFFQKITKENVWTVSIIDNFNKLIQRHHKSIQNFQVAGSSLEASAKVYVLRVDSLHSDTCRMVADLARQCKFIQFLFIYTLKFDVMLPYTQ